MLHYEFPKIEHISQLTEALKDRDEFKFTVKEGYTVVCYAVGFEDTFSEPRTGNEELDTKLKLRREARGLIFCNTTGKVISRRFHKFFNVNEKEETKVENVDLSIPHIILDKLDGSMVTPFKVNGNILWGTKRGETDVSSTAVEFVENNPNYLQFANHCLDSSLTPIFEWCTDKHRVVIKHNQDKLILTAIRSNVTGYYMQYSDMLSIANEMDIPVVGAIQGGVANLHDFLQKAKDLTGVEGFVIRFNTGHMLKIKTEEYLKIHRAKDSLSLEKNVWKIILSNLQDDVISILPEEDAKKLADFSNRFNHELVNKSNKYEMLVNDWIRNNGSDRKRFAVEFVNGSNFTNIEKTILFSLYTSTNTDAMSIIKDYLLKQCSSITNIELARPFLNNIKWRYTSSE